VLIGATAVGKTGILTDMVARRFPDRCELISADSRQVYRGMDIGTATPTAEERAAIPHHLIDIIDPDEQYDLGRFVADADRCVAEIRRRGRMPIIVGGTAFYIRGFLYGPPGTPDAPPELREALWSEHRRRGGAAMHDELRRIDPESAAVIDPKDHYRVLRALEVYRVSGRPRSSFVVPTEPRIPGDVTIVQLRRPREVLYARINRRVDTMMQAGLPEEVERLRAAGYGPDAPGMRTIGYRQFFETEDRGAIRELIARDTRRYAKRQETFFRQFADRRVVDADDTDTLERIIAEILRSTSENLHGGGQYGSG